MTTTFIPRAQRARFPSNKVANPRPYSGDRWRFVLWSTALLLQCAWFAAEMEHHRWHHRDRAIERQSALNAVHQKNQWFALNCVSDLKHDPRAARILGESVREASISNSLPTVTIGRLLKALPVQRELPPGTTLVDPKLNKLPPATIIELAVHDPNGNFIPGLTRVDFEVFQQGQRLRQIEVAPALRQSTDQSVIVLIDCSTSMKGAPMSSAKEVGKYFIEESNNAAQIQIWRFSDKAAALTPWTSEREVLTTAVESLSAQGNTALYAGIDSAIRTLRERTGHRSLVVLTDGEDSAKTIAPASLISFAKEHKVELHVVGLLSGKFDASILRSLADETNGSFHTAADAHGLMTAFRQIADKLRQPVYRLVILDRLWIHGSLTLRMDGLPELTLRY